MSFLKNYFYFLFFSIMLWSCAERGGHHSNLDSFNRYLSYNVVETTHFVFISKDIDIPTLRQLADVSENVYYSISYELGNSYSFSKPYKIFVYSQVYEKFSDIGDEEDAKVIFSTNTPASISGVIASVMLRDIVGDCLDLYPILHYGYKIYHERKSSLAIENYYLSIISDLLKISKGQTDIKNIEISPASTKKSDILNEMKILIDDGYLSEVTKKGLGTQNLIIISLFRIMAEYMRDEEKKFIIYGIDEPEIGLHPHGQRQLINSLKELSEVSQVIITTHSEHLIDLTQIDNVIRIVKENNATKQYKINLTADEKKILEIHGRNLEEIFFAKQVLIVEGDTEEGFFPEASKKVIEKKENEEIEENYSFDYNSVSVINGKGNNIWFFIRLLKSLNIPFVVLIDEDKLNDKNSFLKKIEENNLIEKEEIKKLKDINNKEELKSVLKKYNIFILLPFEKIISENSKKETLRKIVKAINFVKEQWGNEIESNYFETDNVKKEDVFELLKRNKGWRIGKAVAQELNYDELPKDYVEIIKRVSKLWLGQ